MSQIGKFDVTMSVSVGRVGVGVSYLIFDVTDGSLYSREKKCVFSLGSPRFPPVYP